MRKIVAVIGDAVIEKGGDKYKLAFETGKMLVDNGFRVQSGGLGGVMEAAFMGARSSKNYKEGDTIQIKVFRDEGFAQQVAAGEQYIDMNKIGEGEYIDLQVTLRVVDDLNM